MENFLFISIQPVKCIAIKMLSQTCDMSQQERPMSLVFLGQKVTAVSQQSRGKSVLNWH